MRLQADQPEVIVPLALPHQLGLTGEVVFVRLDRPREAGTVGALEPVGILTDYEVALHKAQDTLRFDAEGPYAEVRTAVHERLPHVQPVGCRNVDLVAQFACRCVGFGLMRHWLA